ncbi:hypothetical protein BDP27DRAFT_1371009 [Rhodocollybia butyracea]|uniref:Uncharacterized protein n=1 Tax=Rhodocollybia butyracea TaxID=206335 RepID=A0A9P5PAT2_9AGAR|nr:hypothetical protein BDP27DRAFT_1371009 [Rhodocollybia butyracea]
MYLHPLRRSDPNSLCTLVEWTSGPPEEELTTDSNSDADWEQPDWGCRDSNGRLTDCCLIGALGMAKEVKRHKLLEQEQLCVPQNKIPMSSSEKPALGARLADLTPVAKANPNHACPTCTLLILTVNQAQGAAFPQRYRRPSTGVLLGSIPVLAAVLLLPVGSVGST